jgi:tetratricopeptide (TPR) repeat protein
MQSNEIRKWINLTDDEGLKKKIIKEGTGPKPENGFNVEIDYKLSLEDGTIIENINGSSFILGKGLAIKAWDIGISTMRLNEKSIFLVQPEYAYGESGFEKLKIPANSPLFYEIELINAYASTKDKNIFSLTEKLNMSKAFREKGNKYFKEKEYYEAIDNFKQGLEILYGEGLSTEARDLMMIHNLNMCNCLNQLGLYDKTIERMDLSIKLRSDHPKIYYYRGIANVNLSNQDDAEKDYDKLFSLTNDTAVDILRKMIDKKFPKLKENKIFKCFVKSNMYDDVQNIKRKNDSDSDDDKEPINRIKIYD